MMCINAFLKNCSLKEEKTQSLKINPSVMSVMGKNRIGHDIAQETLISKLPSKRCGGVIGPNREG